MAIAKTASRPAVDAKLIPPDVMKSFAHYLLEDFRKHPELAERYERETGKKFYSAVKKGRRR